MASVVINSGRCLLIMLSSFIQLQMISVSHVGIVVYQQQAMIPFMEHPSSAPSFSGVRVAQSVVYRVVFCRLMILPSCFFRIVLSVLRFTASDYPFDIFKHFILTKRQFNCSMCSLL